MGRLYIWRVCLNMIKEKPMGFGWNGFAHHYMCYQADYLSLHPDISFQNLADNVAFPYNEYLQITISFGVVALASLVFMVWNVLSSPAKSPKDWILNSLLVNYLVFSFLSYPSDAIYTCLLLPLLILISRKRIFHYGVNIICGIFIIISSIMFIKRDVLALKIRTELFDYNEKDYDTFIQKERTSLALFPEIEDMLLKRVPDGHLTRFFDFVMECAELCPNSESFCRAGDVLAKKGEMTSALEYYEQASQMVPSRLFPRYRAFCLLLETGQTEKAKAKGYEILSIDLKKRSSEVIRIRNEVEQAMLVFN